MSTLQKLRDNVPLCLIETNSGPLGISKARTLKYLIETEYHTSPDSPVSVLINPKFTFPRRGTFKVRIGSETVFDYTDMEPPYQTLGDLTMERLVSFRSPG